MKLVLTTLAIAAIAIAGSQSAQGQIITAIDNHAAFDAAVTGETTDDLEGLGQGNGQFFGAGTVVGLGEGTLANATQVFAVGPGNVLGSVGDGSNYLVGNGSSDTIFSPISGTVAAGTDIFSLGSSDESVTAVVTASLISNPATTIQSSFTFAAFAATGSTPLSFAGFLAPTGYTITSIDYQQSAGLDNISIATGTAAVPEPSTWAMLGLGAVGLLFVLKLRGSRI